jgi:spore germination protein KA
MYDLHLYMRDQPPDLGDMEALLRNVITVGESKANKKLKDAVDGLLSGNAMLLVDGFDKALDIGCKGYDKRSVTEPLTESVVRGPREGFTENLRTNTALLRRKIRNPDFIIEPMKIGARTGTGIAIAYIRGLCNQSVIDNVKARLRSINTDSILESGYIEQYIEDNPFSIFSTVGYSEKPDTVAGKILEGRCAIIIDGSPIVLTVPMLFIESFQSAEDYYTRPLIASMMRLVRFIAFGISVLTPAFYVAMVTFHQELIPTKLMLTMSAAAKNVPFPASLEVLIMLLSFEIVREAGVRLPRPVGQAISIVGALIVGQAAVSAGLVGAPVVIVVALTAVSSFIVPNHVDSGAFIRLILSA